MKRNLPNNSITCKIRLLETEKETVDLLKMIETCGVSAVTIHARHVPDRPRDPANWEKARSVIEASNLNIPVIINGDVNNYDDIAKIKLATNANSVMIARGALYNPSIFNPITNNLDDVIVKFLKKCVDFENYYGNTKYILQQILNLQPYKHRNDQVVHNAKTHEEIYNAWDVQEYYNSYVNKNNKKQLDKELINDCVNHTNKKQKLEEEIVCTYSQCNNKENT